MIGEFPMRLAGFPSEVLPPARATPVVRTVLTREWRGLRRNRGVLLFTVCTLLFAESFLRLTGSAERALVAMLNLVLLLVPLVSMMLGIISWHGAREFTELLLTQPVRRSRLFLALYLAQVLPLASGFVVAIGAPLLWHGIPDRSVWPLALSTIGSGVALTFVFGGLALLIGIRVDDRLRSVVAGLMTWLVLSIGYDALVLLVSTTFADYALERPMMVLMLGNPVDLARTIIVMHSDTAALMGYTGAVLHRFLGTTLGSASAALGLLWWMVTPAWLACRAFERRDF
ncbi:MAG TPA: hypothetical protein VGE27_06030 [Gemmatimonas sp.]|uniref:ABC transporter permease n=1 Tax=Gemmatimonas sp. TaxID=1962908 RepID=UPI002ED922D5